MKAVLMSIKPKWCELIASGKKTVEVRKTKPKIETPFKVYIYETKDKSFEYIGVVGYRTDGTRYNFLHRTGKVIGEFVCDRINYMGWFRTPQDISWKDSLDVNSCLTSRELYEYSNGDTYYELHISDLVIYDEPKELGEFHKIGYRNTKDNVYGWTTEEELSWQIKRPPQSWMYVEEVK